jgi:hypothetical protein
MVSLLRLKTNFGSPPKSNPDQSLLHYIHRPVKVGKALAPRRLEAALENQPHPISDGAKGIERSKIVTL